MWSGQGVLSTAPCNYNSVVSWKVGLSTVRIQRTEVGKAPFTPCLVCFMAPQSPQGGTPSSESTLTSYPLH